MKWVQLAQDKNKWRVFVNMTVDLWAPNNAENYLTSSATISFSRGNLLKEVYCTCSGK